MDPDKVGLFGDVLRFSPPYFCVALLAGVLFFFDWWLTFKKTGWKVDYWQFTTLMAVFIPVILLYPFSGSVLQMGAVGNAFYKIDMHIEQAFSISLFGYGCLLLGRFVFDAIGYERSSAMVSAVFGPLETMIYRNTRSGALTLMLGVVIIPLFALVLYLAAGSGFFRLSVYFLREDQSFRAVYNLLLFVYPILPMYYWLRNYERMTRWKWALWALMLLGTLALGTRSVIFTTVLACYLFNAIAKRGAISYARGVLLFFSIAVISLTLSALREGHSVAETLLALWRGVFYGNGLSDLRDFSWGLSSWDGEFWLGKTYLAGLMGFVPRVLSSFREEWALGVVTAQLAGFSPTEHAGIRLDIFGEAYMNFGLVGVFLLSVLNGFTLRYADAQIKRRIAGGCDLLSAYVVTIPYQVTSTFYNSTTFSALYTFLAIQFAAMLVRICLEPISLARYKQA